MGYAAAIHEPLHDNGALFIVKLSRCRIDFFLRRRELIL